MNANNIRSPRRRMRQLGVVALAALAVACSSSTTAIAEPATHGVEAPIEAIPWSQVGPGWMLASWSPVIGHRPGETPDPNEPTSEEATATLYLIDPAGNRYPITTFPAGSTFRMVDWARDGSHALLYAHRPGVLSGGTVISVDLHNGQQSTFPVVDDGPIGYARSDGTAVLIGHGRYSDSPASLERVDLTGKRELTYPVGNDYKGGALLTPDGMQVVLGTTTGLSVMGNDATPGRTLPVPAKLTACSPIRWWSPTVVLAYCMDPVHYSPASQLWQVPIDGSTPTALTAVNSGHEDDPGFGGDFGDTDAWPLPSGTFLQSIGACGTIFLSRLTPDGHTTRVNVPGVSSSVEVSGVSGDNLVLLAKAGCGPSTSLLTYDPAGNTVTVLLGRPVNGGSVAEAMVYPGPK